MLRTGSVNGTGLLGCAGAAQRPAPGALTAALWLHVGEGCQEPAGPLGHRRVSRADSQGLGLPSSAAGAHQ